MLPEHRAGRGRYWKPKAAGYTDHLSEAGLYQGGFGSPGDTSREVPAVPELRAEIERLTQRVARLRAMLDLAENGISTSGEPR